MGVVHCGAAWLKETKAETGQIIKDEEIGIRVAAPRLRDQAHLALMSLPVWDLLKVLLVFVLQNVSMFFFLCFSTWFPSPSVQTASRQTSLESRAVAPKPIGPM